MCQLVYIVMYVIVYIGVSTSVLFCMLLCQLVCFVCTSIGVSSSTVYTYCVYRSVHHYSWIDYKMIIVPIPLHQEVVITLYPSLMTVTIVAVVTPAVTDQQELHHQ